MGEQKRIAEAEEARRNKKISFIREHAPQFAMASIFSGNGFNPVDVVSSAVNLFEEIENKVKRIAMGEE